MSKRLSEKNPFLRDAEKKKRLMVSAIASSQRQEGIEISDARAEEVYKVVFEEPLVAFFRLDRREWIEPTDIREEIFVKSLRGEGEAIRFNVPRKDLTLLDESPIAYDRVHYVAELLRGNAKLNSWSAVVGGLNSTRSEQFVRCRWEPASDSSRNWCTYAKGGAFSRFYADLELVFDWTDNGREFKRIVADLYGSASRFVKSDEYYFMPGITWTEKSMKGFSARILPPGAIFNVAGPCAFPKDERATHFLLGIMNSSAAAYALRVYSTRSFGADSVRKLPVPHCERSLSDRIAKLSSDMHAAKARWDQGHEVSSRFVEPWLVSILREQAGRSVSEVIDDALFREAKADSEVREWYSKLDAASFEAFGVSAETREVIMRDLGPRPPELIWPQMEGKSAEQKRMEHVWRLLSFCAKRVIEGDDDGIVPLVKCSNEPPLEERVLVELEKIIGADRLHEFEGEVASELRKRVPGYKRADSIGDWLTNFYFEHHVRLYKSRPIYWNLASGQQADPAFSVVVHYHRFGKDALRKLRGSYVRGCLDRLERELGHARKENRAEDAVELQQKIDEVRAFDRKLQALDEGEFAIRVPWKDAAKQPQGWAPDIDDGVKVNILPLQTAGLLRIAKVVSAASEENE